MICVSAIAILMVLSVTPGPLAAGDWHPLEVCVVVVPVVDPVVVEPPVAVVVVPPGVVVVPVAPGVPAGAPVVPPLVIVAGPPAVVPRGGAPLGVPGGNAGLGPGLFVLGVHPPTRNLSHKAGGPAAGP